jgi:dihydrofolate reductase
MRKVIFGINNTINGFADHTAVIADDELHDFFTNLLNDADVVLMGRKTYQLMENFWPVAYKDPNSTKSMLRFADKYNPIKKIVFSKTLTEVKWENSQLANDDLSGIVSELKKQKGKNILAGSIRIAEQLLKLNLIDEFWFVVHPIIAGNGPRLFDGIDVNTNLQFVDLQKFSSGAIALHYKKQEVN